VLFSDFGDNSLNFELALWTASMTTRPRRFISSINFAIEKKLRENNIEIPFPQRDLHIRSGSVEIKRPTEAEPSTGQGDRPEEDSR
jgi:small-conductance mechanosensitive channel